MSVHSIQDSNALLLYKVGPVLVCSPTMLVEAVVMPPKFTATPGSGEAEPGVFKSIHGLVRVVDLRLRFGVDKDDIVTPGRIIIAEVEGGHAGFWVDEIEDVTAFPETGWSQVPSHIPREVFSRTLVQDNQIRLYADFEKLDKFKSTGYLRRHIEILKAKKEDKEAVANKVSVKDKTTKTTDSDQPEKDSKTPEVTARPLAETESQEISSTDSFNNKNRLAAKSPRPADSPLPREKKSPSNDLKKPTTAETSRTLAAGKSKQAVTNASPALSRAQTATVSSTRQKQTVSQTPGGVSTSGKPVSFGDSAKAAGQAFQASQTAKSELAMSVGGSMAGSMDRSMERPTEKKGAEHSSHGMAMLMTIALVVVGLMFIVYQMFESLENGAEKTTYNNSQPLEYGLDNEYLDRTMEEASIVGSRENKADIATEPVEMETTEQEKQPGDEEKLALNKPGLTENLSAEQEIKADPGPEQDVEAEAEGRVKISRNPEGVVIVVDETMNNNEMPLSQTVNDSESTPRIPITEQTKNLSTHAVKEQDELDLKPAPVEKTLAEESSGNKENIEMLRVEKQREKPAKQENSIEKTEPVNRPVKKSQPEPLSPTSKTTRRKFIHIVVKGDTLWHIAKRYINNPWRYPELAKLSKIKNPDLIYPGDKVVIIIKSNQSDD